MIGDGSLFDSAVGGPATGSAFDPEFDGAVGALSFEHGRATPGGPFQLDPAAGAAARFDDLLEAAGVVLPNGPGVRTGAGARAAGGGRGRRRRTAASRQHATRAP